VTARRSDLGSVGRLALIIAAFGGLLLWLRVSQYALGRAIFCDWTSDCSAILWANAPFHFAILGMAMPLIPISLALHRQRVGPRLLRAATLVTGAVGSLLAVVAVLAAYDRLWASYVGPFGLDVPPRTPLLPAPIGITSWAAWPTMAGAWVALTSAQLVRARLPAVIAMIGLVAGGALVVSAPYVTERFVVEGLMPLELILSVAWATAVGVYLTTVRNVPVAA
jgi:hypothetical protein